MSRFLEAAIVGGVAGLATQSTLTGVLCALAYIIIEAL